MSTSKTPPVGQSGSTNAPDNQSPSDAMVKATAAIAQLAALERRRREQAAKPQTVEDVVRELIRPMLEHWLDRTVPKLVEEALRPELTRAFDGH